MSTERNPDARPSRPPTAQRRFHSGFRSSVRRPDLVPARMINEALYCERMLYLEWAQGEFADNAFTVEGRATHKRADQPGGHLPAPLQESATHVAGDATVSATIDGASEERILSELPYQARTIWLSSKRLGITAKIDVVEGHADGNVVRIEYKRGKAPDLSEGAYLPERAQLCAQVLLLRKHGYSCDHGDIRETVMVGENPIPVIDDGAPLKQDDRLADELDAKIPIQRPGSPPRDACHTARTSSAPARTRKYTW